ncbi:MAG TPA: DUF4437 domain-containing protein [Pseudomonadota bacterium]|jgi:mannose-6-phosphate isomerase-like protein (cupin superfamily)|nr:DUF4437 domain-containing protein [Pseudomonadota bacterium]
MVKQTLLSLVIALGLSSCADPPDPPEAPKPCVAACDCEKLTKALKEAQAPVPCVRADAVETSSSTEKSPPYASVLPKEAEFVQTKELEWEDFPTYAESASAAQLKWNPKTKGVSGFLKLPKKFDVEDMKHSCGLISSVLKGSVSVQLGEDKPTTVKAGGFLFIPANTPYRMIAKKEAILFLTTDGPFASR